jgi:ABC-type nitrate/sulfonate/bicarbonate transport system ATPase subunit
LRLDVVSVHKQFRRADGRRLDVLDGLSFSVEPRGFVCLVGPSGCGKSTILNILAGVLTPDAGEIRIDCQPLDRGRHRIGYVFQRPRLLNWKTVQQNVEFALKADGLGKEASRSRAREALALVGLEQFASEYPLALSGGMQQRVAIARALALEPQILLMDEPFSHLDELTARAQRRELLRFRDKIAATVVFVTHNALEAVYLSDRVAVLTARPARVLQQFPIEAPRTRAIDDPYLIRIQQGVLRALGVEGWEGEPG